jgi:hypothetical protein
LTYGGNSKIGWDWVQEYYDNPLTIGIKDGWYILGWEAFASQGGGFSSLFNMRRFYFNEVQFVIEQFKASVRFMMQYYYTSRRTCFYGYYFVDDYLMNFTMQMKFQECYKNLLNCIWSLDAWNTKYSKYID